MSARRDRVEIFTAGSWTHVDQRQVFHWSYISANGRILADGAQGYSRRIDALKGARRVTGIDLGFQPPRQVWQVTRCPQHPDPWPRAVVAGREVGHAVGQAHGSPAHDFHGLPCVPRRPATMTDSPIYDSLRAAEQGRDQAFANLDAADKAAELETILDAIRHVAMSHEAFTANEVRPHLPKGVNTNRVGRAFYRAIELGFIEAVDIDRSNKRNTHRARINVYRTATSEQGAA